MTKTRKFYDDAVAADEQKLNQKVNYIRRTANEQSKKLSVPHKERVPRLVCPDRVPIRFRLYDSQNGICHFCKNLIEEQFWTIDHLTPISRGGTNDESNLVGACKSCNQSKGAMTEAEYVGYKWSLEDAFSKDLRV